jgi:predicted O-methyltransferase YrrM
MFERTFLQRPRILNLLHRFGVARATSQTNQEELDALCTYAKGAGVALEIGSYQGVSAGRIAAVLGEQGRLYCIDPWQEDDGRPNPNLAIFKRHIARRGLQNQIHVIRAFTGPNLVGLPEQFDFAFIDGDHSWMGIETDWTLVSGRIAAGGYVCLHDTAIPAAQPWRKFPSVDFFDQRILGDSGFALIDTVYSMRVLRKREPSPLEDLPQA